MTIESKPRRSVFHSIRTLPLGTLPPAAPPPPRKGTLLSPKKEFGSRNCPTDSGTDNFRGALRCASRRSDHCGCDSFCLSGLGVNIARADGKIQFAPVIRLLEEPPPRKGFVTRAQFETLLSKLPVNLRSLVTFLYYCGVRVGEAVQIEWSQVDLHGALIRLEGEHTKTSEPRVVSLPDVLVDTLKQVKNKEGLVFDDMNLREDWAKAVVGAGMPGLLVYDLRRSAIRNLIAAGVPEKVAMSISGHKTRSVFDRYHIVDATDVVNAMSRLQNKQLAESKNGESLV